MEETRPNTLALAQAKQVLQSTLNQLEREVYGGRVTVADAGGLAVEWRRLKEVIDSFDSLLDKRGAREYK